MNKFYYVYILKSLKDKSFYVGWTSDLRKRFKSHNRGENISTKYRRPWKLVYYSAFITEKEAKAFEKYLKCGSGRAFMYKRLVALAKDAVE